MTGKKFLLYWFLYLVIFTSLKVWFFNYEIFSNFGVQEIVFWALSAVIGAALVRRLGIINYLESFFTMLVWILSGAFFDLLITAAIAGLGIFFQPAYWGGFISMSLAIFLFHKKRHIHVRHELHSHGHGHKH
jgi:hypothetical protein